MNSGLTQLDLTFMKANRILKIGDYETPLLHGFTSSRASEKEKRID
jgi:hypothetical protein